MASPSFPLSTWKLSQFVRDSSALEWRVKKCNAGGGAMSGTFSRWIRLFRKSRAGVAVFAASAMVGVLGAASLPNLFPSRDPSGLLETYHGTGSLDANGPFFQSLGTTGRSCATCHVPANAFALSATRAESVYERTHGHDPLFATVDGAACPTPTAGHPLNFDLLRRYGLFRIALPLAPHPQFTISQTAIQPSELGKSLKVFRSPEAHPEAHTQLMEMLAEIGIEPEVLLSGHDSGRHPVDGSKRQWAGADGSEDFARPKSHDAAHRKRQLDCGYGFRASRLCRAPRVASSDSVFQKSEWRQASEAHAPQETGE